MNNSFPLGVTRVLSLLTPIKPINMQSPYGGPGGSRTRVQNTFLFASYSNKDIYFTTNTMQTQPRILPFLLQTGSGCRRWDHTFWSPGLTIIYSQTPQSQIFSSDFLW